MDKVKVFYVILVLIVINNSNKVSSDSNCGSLENAKSGEWKLSLLAHF